MRRKVTLMKLALATAFAAPVAACAQAGGSQSGQSSSGPSTQPSVQAQRAQPAQPEWVVLTITPVEQRVMNEQRRESLFRALDANGDGQISMAEAGVNTQLLNAFQKLDRNSNRALDRQEFARVHVDDGSRSAQASSGQSSGGASLPPRYADEPWSGHRPPRSASSGATTAGEPGALDRRPTSPLPSRSIEERSIGGYVGETVPPNTPGHPGR